jgi:hypothetical protein
VNIRPGETVAGLRTLYFPIFTSEGLLATGGSDGNYEGAAISAPTVQYQHNRDGWTGASGTFVAPTGGGEAAYPFTTGEAGSSLSKGTLAVRVSRTGFRTQTVRVTFGDGIQPGETVDDNRRLYFPMFTDAGYVVSGGTDTKYEVDSTYVADLLAHAVVEYQHDSGGWGSAANALVHEGGDEWSYTFSNTEVGAGLSRGTVSIRVTATGALLDVDGNQVVYRTTIVRADFGFRSGDAVAPTITAISPLPSVTPGDAGGFPLGTSAAAVTPIIATIFDASGLEYVVAAIRIYGSDDEPSTTEETVYRDGAMQGRFFTRSSASIASDGTLTLTIGRDPGWSGKFVALAIDAIDSSGNVTSETFVYELPAGTAEVVPVMELTTVEDASINRLAQQFREDS